MGIFDPNWRDVLHSLKYKKKTAVAYGKVFGRIRDSASNDPMTDDQKRVLADLSTFCEAGLVNHSSDPIRMAIHTGRIEVFNHIIGNIEYKDFVHLETEIKKTQGEINDAS